MTHWQFAAIHAKGNESLGMQGIVHIDAIPKTGLYGGVNHILGLGMNSYLLQNVM